MDKIKELQNQDPLAIAEKLTGKSYKEDENTTWLGMAIQMEKTKIINDLMDSTNDTKFSETEEDYLKKVIDFGFVSVLVLPFKNEHDIEERLHILFHKEYSILLVFDTFTWEDDGSWAKAGKEVPKPSRNGGNFYYNWSANDIYDRYNYTSNGSFEGVYWKLDFSEQLINPEKEPKWNLEGQSYVEFSTLSKEWGARDRGYIKNNNLKAVWVGHHDCREALKNNINLMVNNGTFLKKWKKQPFLWLLHHGDTKIENYDYAQINQTRLNLLPDWVKECICV